MTEENAQAQEPEDNRSNLEKLLDILATFKDAPSRTQLEEWKRIYSGVHTTGLDDDEIYIWRSIKRDEYKSIRRRLGALPEAQASEADSIFEEDLTKLCVLWPKITDAGQLKAGTLTALKDAIMTASNFLETRFVLMNTRKL